VRLVDSHCHLDDDQFDKDRDEVIERARAAGVERMMAIGTGEGPPDLEVAIRLAEKYPFVYATVGVHPHEARKAGDETFADLRKLARHPKVLAIGEIGLDYHYDHSPRERQRAAFAAQLALAGEHGRPAVVHTRDAEDDTCAMIAEAGRAGVRGVLHCYTGSHSLARTGLDAGWFVSFSGIVTFRKWTDDALVRLVPDDRILVESDAPYLAPVPHRGRRNEPAYVPRTIERVATVRGVPVEALGALTTANARSLFGLA